MNTAATTARTITPATPGIEGLADFAMATTLSHLRGQLTTAGLNAIYTAMVDPQGTGFPVRARFNRWHIGADAARDHFAYFG